MGKRMLSLILSILMLTSVLPAAAFADQTHTPETGKKPLLPTETAAVMDHSAYLPAGITAADVGDHTYNEREYNNTKSSANVIYHDYTVNATLSSSDKMDYFTFNVNEPTKVTILAVAKYDTLAIMLDDEDGNMEGWSWRGQRTSNGNYAHTIEATLTFGEYYIGMTDLEMGYNVYTLYIMLEPTVLAPKIQAFSGEEDGIPVVRWDYVIGAEKYEIYRATSRNGTYKKVKTMNYGWYCDTGIEVGKLYYYKVRSVTKDGQKSEFSNIESAARKLLTPEVTITNVSSTGKIRLTWNAVEGAVGYQVYRVNKAGENYRLLKTTTATSYTNNNAEAGKKYFYRVIAVHDLHESCSYYTDVLTRTCDLARPEVNVTLNGSGKPYLTWKAIEGAEGYKIYRATSKDGTYKFMKTTTRTSYTNNSAESGKTYYYKIRAIHPNTVAYSAYSTVKSIKAK